MREELVTDEISIGDYVCGMDGKYHRVSAVTNRPENILYTIKSVGLPELKCTKEHPILAVSKTSKKSLKHTRTVNLEWKKAEDLQKGDFVVIPIPDSDSDINWTIDLAEYDNNIIHDEEYVYYKYGFSPNRIWSYKTLAEKLNTTKRVIEKVFKHIKEQTHFGSEEQRRVAEFIIANKITVPEEIRCKRFIEVDDDILWMLGWFIAEGDATESIVEFNFHKNEKQVAERIKDIIDEKFGIKGTIRIRDHNRCVLTISSKILAKFFRAECGHLAQNKKIPQKLTKSYKYLSSLVKAYISGDGYINKKEKIVSVATVSKTLAWQLWQCSLIFCRAFLHR